MQDDGAALVRDLTALARTALPRYGIAADASVSLLSYSENAVFAVADPRTGRRRVLRLHRPHYHSRQAIQSELDWMDALERAGIGAPRSVPGSDGAHVQDAGSPGTAGRMVTVLEWIDGRAPDEGDLLPTLRRLGELAARMHAQSRQWTRPAYFERLVWDRQGTIGARAYWGRWEAAADLMPDGRALLERATQLLGQRLDVFGTGPERYGLIHADQRAANLLIDGERTSIIDFDDCGLGWFLHDLAAALSFIEHRADVDQLTGAWLEGYTRAGALPQADIDEIPSFLLQRRLQLLAWRGSHADTELARSLGPEWVAATVRMGEQYLQRLG